MPLAAVPNGVLFDWLPPALMLGGVIVLGVMMAIAWRSQNARLRDARQSLASGIEQASILLQQIEDVKARAGELIGTAQRLAMKIEEREREFEQLLAEAQDRRATTSPEVHVEPKLGNENDEASIDPLTQTVYELSDSGMAPLDIAQQLQEQVGKVELILALRNA